MDKSKSIALMMVGAAGVLAYQKYSKPIMDAASKVANNSMKKIQNKLENMM
jgi:hypothetical protein